MIAPLSWCKVSEENAILGILIFSEYLGVLADGHCTQAAAMHLTLSYVILHQEWLVHMFSGAGSHAMNSISVTQGGGRSSRSAEWVGVGRVGGSYMGGWGSSGSVEWMSVWGWEGWEANTPWPGRD